MEWNFDLPETDTPFEVHSSLQRVRKRLRIHSECEHEEILETYPSPEIKKKVLPQPHDLSISYTTQPSVVQHLLESLKNQPKSTMERKSIDTSSCTPRNVNSSSLDISDHFFQDTLKNRYVTQFTFSMLRNNTAAEQSVNPVSPGRSFQRGYEETTRAPAFQAKEHEDLFKQWNLEESKLAKIKRETAAVEKQLMYDRGKNTSLSKDELPKKQKKKKEDGLI